MNVARKARHILATGKSGTGKTTIALDYIKHSKHGRVFVFDHQSEIAFRLGIVPCLSFINVLERAKTDRVVCYDPTLDFEGEMENAFDYFTQWVFTVCRDIFEPGKCEVLLVCDEIQTFVNVHFIPKPFKKCLELGRKFALDTLSMSQRPNAINGAAREQFTEIFFLKLDDPNSWKFGEFFGVNGSLLTTLTDGSYVYLNQKTGERRNGKVF